ncbi:MAG: four helix bundle protein [bacterium]
MLKLNHKKLNVWQLAVDFVADIYRATEKFPKMETYGITSQMRRAAVSVPSNIAEGAARKSLIERKRFYEIARSSLVELDTQFEISLKLKYCSIENTLALSEKMNHLFALISQFIKKTN